MINLSGRVVFVTGASRGIGKQIALKCAKAGATVVACAREDHAFSVAQEINVAGGTAEAISLDVTDGDSVMAAVKVALDRFRRIDVLVNNAGIVRDQILIRMKPDEWDDVIATNLTSAFTCVRAVLRPMLKQRWGRVINIGSVVGQSGNSGQINYAASKAGLVGFTKALAREVASRGITVNIVAPGMIETDMTADLGQQARTALESSIPMGRLGLPEDVAGAVCFLASLEASYITGQVINVNGGMYM